MRQEHYTWIPKLIAPRESQWSLLCKFATWNALSVRKLHHLVGLRKAIYQPINLAVSQYIDPDRFMSLTGSTLKQITSSLSTNYVPEGWGKSLICMSLRYCPTCLRQGYHSAIYQIGLVLNCPIHGVPLIDRCDKCGKTIVATQPRSNIDNPYLCNCCSNIFCEIMNVGKMLPLNDKDIEEINKIGTELESLIDETRQRRVYWGKGQSMAESIDLTYSSYAQCLKETYKHAGEISIKDAINICRHLDWDMTRAKPLITLWPVYHSIRRHLWHKLLKNHQKCFRIIGHLGGVYSGFTYYGSFGCVPIHAYIMWRMYWEGHINIASLNLDRRTAINWNHSDVLSDEEILHIFGHDCLASFYKICERAKNMEQTGIFHFMTREEINSLKKGDLFIDNWAVIEASDEKASMDSRVFTWIDRSDDQFFRKDNPKHTEALYATRDKISEAIKRSSIH